MILLIVLFQLSSFLRFGGLALVFVHLYQLFDLVGSIIVNLKLGTQKLSRTETDFHERLYLDFILHTAITLYCFLSGLRPFVNNQDLESIRVLYFHYCKYLLYLPRSYRNQKIIRKYCATDIILFKKLYAKFGAEACQHLGPYHPLIRLYWLYCLCYFVFLSLAFLLRLNCQNRPVTNKLLLLVIK